MSPATRAAALWIALATACGQAHRQPRVVRDDAPRPHDETAHDEIHYFVAVTDKGFEPAVLEVPLEKDIILLFVRRPESPCEAIVVEPFGAPSRTVPLTRGQPVEVHVRFGGGGTYSCDFGSAKWLGTFKAI